MKYKAIIFDMDGTIIDTHHIWDKANRELLAKRGIQLSEHDAQELGKLLSGRAMTECCRLIKEYFNLPDELEDLIKEKAEHADDLYTEGICFVEGFEKFHDKVKKLNLKVGLATNATDQTVALTNKALNLERFFGEHIYNITHVNNKYKPHPALYLHAAEKLGLHPSECIAIEDSTHGIKAAKDAGMLCIGINTAKKPERIQESDFIIDHYDEIRLEELLELTHTKTNSDKP